MSSNTSPKLHSINLKVLNLEITRKMFVDYDAFQKLTERHLAWKFLGDFTNQGTMQRM